MSQLQEKVTNSKKSDNHYLHQVNIKVNIKSDVLFIAFPSWIIALSWWRHLHNSMKLWTMLCGATQDEQVTMESSEKTTSTGGGNDKSLQYSCLENPTNSMKRQKKIWHLEISPPGQKVLNMLLGESTEIAPERTEDGPNGNDTQLCICLGVKIMSDDVKNTASEPGILGPWIKVNWTWPSRGSKREHQHFRYQWTKMEGKRHLIQMTTVSTTVDKNTLEEKSPK